MKSGELLLILAIVFLFFGSKKLPELARGIGQSAKEFRKGLQDSSHSTEEEPPKEQAGG